MTRLARVLAVTSGLVAAGAGAGALAGAAVAGVIAAIVEHPGAALEPGLLGFGATFGAVLGAVLLPLAGWLLMRRVPLGRALLGTAAGAVSGGLLGWFMPVGADVIARTLVAGVAGFLVAVIVLRRSAAAARVGADARAA